MQLICTENIFFSHFATTGATFEVIPYMDARHYSEMHLAKCRREKSIEMDVWQELFNQTFM